MLIVINALAYFGYVFHGWFGDVIGRKKTIIIGWIISGISFAVMLSPIASTPTLIILSYGTGPTRKNSPITGLVATKSTPATVLNMRVRLRDGRTRPRTAKTVITRGSSDMTRARYSWGVG